MADEGRQLDGQVGIVTGASAYARLELLFGLGKQGGGEVSGGGGRGLSPGGA